MIRHGFRTISTMSIGKCVTSALIAVESHPCSGCGTDLSVPALATPVPEGQAWWCEACVGRTLEAIEESRQDPENEA
jgi:hypothetical protein